MGSSSLTRDQTQAPCLDSKESQPTGTTGKSFFFFFFAHFSYDFSLFEA